MFMKGEREIKDTREAQLRKEEADLDIDHAQEKQQQLHDKRLNTSLNTLKSLGWDTLDDFLDALITIKNLTQSSQVSRYLARHGEDFLDKVQQRQPSLVNDWALSTTRVVNMVLFLKQITTWVSLEIDYERGFQGGLGLFQLFWDILILISGLV